MSAAAVPYSAANQSAAHRLVRTGLLITVVDGLWAVVLTLAYQRSIVRLWQGVAAAPFGKSMMDGGTPTMLLGIAVHFVVAFTWSAVFLLLVDRSAWLRGVLSSPAGLFMVAAAYGPLIWILMSLVVIPIASHAPTPITYRWWIQLAGHIFFVGLPIVWSLAPRKP